jgi:glycosyltransferase involved in cell wall biosynthesis
VNILLVNWQDRLNPQAGGAEIHLFEIFARIAARGHRVRLVCSGWPGASARAVVDGIEVLRTGARHSFALLGRRAVRRALRAEAPDIVVEDVNKLPLYLPSVTRLPFCTLIPHLFGTTAFREVDPVSAGIVWVAERGIPRAYRRTGFHAISESTRHDLVARGAPAERIRVIHPGVDAGRFTPAEGSRPAGPPTFVYLGRLKRYKGVETAIRAAVLARRSVPGLTLLVAGQGDDRPRLERLATSLGAGDGVRFLGFVDEATKLRLLRESTANVFPSPKEGWGITVMEAAACGTPSLASDSPGLRDSVRDGETGWLVPHGSPEPLAGRMVELALDPGLAARLGGAARRWAEEHSWDGTASATLAHLEELVQARPHP